MITKTTAIFSLLATVILLTSGCLTADAAARTSDASPETAEATKVAWDWWSHHVTHCGDSYYVFQHGGMSEYRQVSMQIKAEPVTGAQRLNGLSWNGRSVLLAKVARDIYFQRTNPEWGQWVDGAWRIANMT